MPWWKMGFGGADESEVDMVVVWVGGVRWSGDDEAEMKMPLHVMLAILPHTFVVDALKSKLTKYEVQLRLRTMDGRCSK